MHPPRLSHRRAGLPIARSLSRFGLLALLTALVAALITPSAIVARDDTGTTQTRTLPPVIVREAQAAARHNDVHGQVVGGTLVSQGDANFAVFVQIDVGGGFAVLCGGSLIAPRFVLTAAHCVEDDESDLFDPSQYLLAIGQVDLSKPVPDTRLRGVVDVHPHPLWAGPPTFANDVALLELDEAVPGSIATPIPIIGSGDTHLDSAGQPVTIAGWGLTSGDPKVGTDTLHKANLAVISDAACDATFQNGIDEAAVICAGATDRSSCSGDSGGPLIATGSATAGHGGQVKAHQGHHVKAEGKKHKKHKKKHKRKHMRGGSPSQPITGIQIGVVSFAVIGCPAGLPGGYAQLSSPTIHDFIDGVIGN